MSSASVYSNVVHGGVEGIASGRKLPNAVARYYNNVVIEPTGEGLITSEDGAEVYANTIVGTGAEGIVAKGHESSVFDNIIAGSVGEAIIGRATTNLNNIIGGIACIVNTRSASVT